ncbi:MAG: sigma-70 family RNA polymerase sigma factor [Thiovulaceae bacterium]|nr:sigma-70 family RNA polymerase sigma factor [Sulfurimonadaceae bacterium]
MNELELIKSITSGNTTDYKYIVEKYTNIVFRTCLGYVHNREEAEDLTQEVFISAFKSLEKFKGNSAFSTWLYRISVNTSLNHLRSKQGNKFKNLFRNSDLNKNSNDYINIASSDISPEENIINSEKRSRVNYALSKLPENQKTAIILSKYNDLSQKEIADVMGKTEGAVEALIQRAKENLKKILIKN